MSIFLKRQRLNINGYIEQAKLYLRFKEHHLIIGIVLQLYFKTHVQHSGRNIGKKEG